MVAFITGRGVGLERSSALVLGSRGQSGPAGIGRDGEGVYVNAANGNLVITRQDEFLIGLGPNISVDRTYNSQAVISDGDNNDNWRMSPYRKVTGLSGTYGAAGTTVKRIDWDGSDTLFTWNATYIDATHGAYVATDGRGAYDMLVRSGTTWTWTDGDSQTTETYDDNNGGRITAAADPDGNSVTYAYNGSGQISRVTSNNAAGTADDDYTDFSYSGTLLTQVVTTKGTGGSVTRARYTYLGDGTNRLATVTVDLSPNDGVIADGYTYFTTYTYDGSSTRVASITQQDGSSISFTYVQAGADFRVASFTQSVAAGVTRSTSFDYSVANRTTITDPAGRKTILWYNANNELTQISYPPEDANTTPRTVQFGYDVSGDGDVTSVILGPGNVVTYDYDQHGNRKFERDSAGNTIARTFSAKNELLTETRYLVPDPDGVGAGQPGTSVTTRYAYDAESHLRYIVSAEGFVTQYEYNTPGQQTAANEYVANAYNLAGLADNVSIAEGTLTSWVSALDKTGSRRTQTTYDYRGNVATVTSYSKLLSNGLFDGSSELSQTNYVYDQAGKLLSRTVTGSAGSEQFVYDGLGRQTMATNFNGGVTTVVFTDASATTTVTLASGLKQISTYNRAGELIFYTETDNASLTATSEYRYDSLGRLRMTIDPTGRASYLLYDSVGRKVADIDTDGSVIEYRYDGNDNLTSTTRYVTKLTAAQLVSLAVFDTGNGAPVTSATGSTWLTNGSFDTSGAYTTTATGRSNTDLPGWTKTNAEVFEQVTAGQLGVTGTDGAFWLDLDSVPGTGALPTGPNLLTNGSFETSGSYTTLSTGRSNTSLPNWTKTNAENFEQVTSGQMGVAASDGTYWLDLDSVVGSGALLPTGSNLVLNPSFETSAASYTAYSWGRSSSTLPNWTKTNGQDFEQVTSGNYGVNATNGSYWLDLDSIPSTLVTVGGNLLLNPSFETVASGANQLAYGYSSSTLPNWTKANNELFEQVVTGNFGVSSSNGSYWLDMDSVPGPGTYAASGPNLLVNGSFDISGNYLETSSGRANSTLPGWTKANAESFEQVSGLGNNIQASDGGYWLDMDSVSGGVVPLGDNLIVNGSFETSGSTYTTTSTGRLNTAGIPGWTRVSSQTFEQTNAGVGGVTGTNGSYYLDMEASGNADISQTVTGLTSGQQLLISFDYANVAGSVLDGEGNPDAGGSLQVFWNGTQIAWIANPSSTMTTKSYTVTATGTTGTLRFKEVGGSNGVGVSIDNVKVTRTQSAPSTGGNMDISQTVGNLAAGQVLQLQFDHANRTSATSGSFEVYWNGALIATYNNTGYTMVTETLSVTAIAGNNVLRFKGTGTVDALGAALDNVRLYATSYIPNGGNMDISQTVGGLTAGQIMRLQFDHANRTTAGSGSFNVYWNGNLVAQVTSTGVTMLTETYDVVAIAGTNTLRFLGTGTVDSNGASLDNVRLFATQATPNGGNMDISQAINGLTAGQTYMFQFDHANRAAAGSGSFDVYWNTTLLASITSTGTTMVPESYNVVAAAGANTIRFVGTGTVDAAGASIDNVRLFATQVDVGGGNMDISQSVSGLAAGQTYQLQFDHANRTTAGSGSFEVYWNTTLIATITSTGTTMVPKTYNVVAAAGANTLRFKGTGTVDANGASIDNVRLFATTNPVGGGNMDISQNVPSLAAGQIVQLQFNHANRTTAASGSFEVYWNNNLVATISETGTAMQTKTYLLTAVAGTNTLRFKGTGAVDANGASIDNVRLFATSTTLPAASLGVKLADIRPLANANDAWTFQVYDLAQRLVQTIDGTGATSVLSYDGASRLVSTTNYANRLDSATLASLKALATNPNRWNLDANGLPLSRYNLTATAAGTIDGANAYQLTVGPGTDWQTIYTDGPTLSPGQVASATITAKAVGSITIDSFGLYGVTSAWGPDSDAYATIVSGPGQLSYQYGGFFQVSGLSTTEATRITITRTYRMSEWASPYFYIGSGAVVPGQSTIIAAPVFSSPSSPLLPAADAANDRVSRNFYDNDGRLIGTLDGEGYLTQTVYDKGGNKIQTIAYSGATGAGLRAAGSFAQLLASITIDNAKDIRNHFVYDSRGMLRATVDGEGNLTRTSYFPLGAVAQVISGQKLDPIALIATPPTFANLPAAPGGTILQTISYTRDLYGKALTETVSLTGGTTTTIAYAYDVMGRLVATTTQSGGADPRTASQRFDKRGRLIGELDGIGNATLPGSPTQAQIDQAYASYGISHAYDAADRMISSTDARGARSLYYYDTDGRLVFQVDPLGEVAEFRYDALGRRTDTIVYTARIASATLAGMTGGNVTAVAATMATLANAGIDTSHADFDVDGSVKQSSDPLGNVTTFSYNAFGELITDVAPRDGAATIQSSRSYDRRGLLKTEIVDSAAGGKAISTTYGYDAFGRAVTLTNALNKLTSSAYDRKGRLVSTTDATNAVTSYAYDARDNLVAVTDALGKVTRNVYDKAGRKIAVIDALGEVTAITYDADGRVVASRAYFNTVNIAGLPLEVTESALALPATNAADHVTRYAYDKDGQLRFTVDGLMHVVENVYDVAGNVVRTIAYDGTIATDGTGVYSASWIAGQVAGLAAAPGTRISRSVYDLANRLNYAIDALGQVTWVTFDAKGQIIKQVELAALYTTAGDPALSAMDTWRTANAGANDRTTRAYYDRKGRLSYSIDALGYVTRFEYDKLANVKKLSRYATASGATDATTLANLDSTYASPPADTRVTQFNYDSAGRLEETIDPEGYSTKLVLDQLGQVTSSTAAFGLTAASVTTYTYDDVGRVLTETRGSGAAEASVTAFVYDALGQMTQRTAASGTGDASISKWEYDAVGQLTKDTRAFGTSEIVDTLIGYDSFGRVISTTDPRGSVVTRSYNVLDDLLSETEQLEAGTADDQVTTYTYDSFGNAVKVRDARDNDSFTYFDKLGRAVREVDAEKYVTDTTYTRGGKVASLKRWANRATGTIVETSMPADPTADTLHDASTVFTYNNRDELTAVLDAGGYTESYGLNAFGDRTSLTNKLNNTINYTFDKRGLLLTETLPITTKNAGGATIGVVNSYAYDARGNRTQMIEAAGAVEARTTNYAYDKLDRLITTTHDLVTIVNDDMTSSNVTPTETLKYDRRGNVIETIDAGGARTLFWYDDLDRAIWQLSQTDKVTLQGSLTRTSYDGNDNVASTKAYGDLIALPADATGPAPTPYDANNFRLVSYGYDRANRRTTATMAALRTGVFIGTSYNTTFSGDVTSTLYYDKAGNAFAEADANGNGTWIWYDKLGRAIAQVDREYYLTAWTRDAEGNVLSETRYATQLGSFSYGATPPSVGASAADRTTTFTYDKNGRRLTESRSGVAYGAISGTGALSTGTAASTLVYTYNGLGEVLTKTEANYDLISYSYDAIGRVTLETGQSFTDYQGATATPRTVYAYDGLNNVRSSRSQMGAAANDTNDRITSYTYGAGGRLATMTDAAGFAHSYGYDAAGHVVRDSYTRLKSDGVTGITEAQVTRYDLAGRAIVQTSARFNGSAWVFTDLAGYAYDAVRLRYNAYGEVSGRGLTAGPGAAAVYQETFDYDEGGRLWRSTGEDGSIKILFYDRAGNATLTLSSVGANLSGQTYAGAMASLTAAGGTTIANAVTTISVFDRRGQQIQTREPGRQLSAATSTEIVRARAYNAFGEVTSETDARGYATTFTYNTMGRLLSKVSPQVSVTAENGGVSLANPTEYYSYDLSGRMLSIDDSNGNRITRQLLAGSGHGDAEALITKEFHPDTGVAETRYDVFGDARVSINEIGSTETRDYDKLGRLTTVFHPVRAAGTYGNATGAAVQLVDYYGYDGLGQRTQHWNSQLGQWVKETTDYDAEGRVVATVGFGGDGTGYTYIWDSNLTTAGLGAFGGWAKITYNSAGLSMTERQDYFGRTIDQIDFGGHNYDFAFDYGGRLIARSNSAGESVGYSYYNSGLISGQTGTQGTAGYEYDAAGNRTRETFSKGAGYRDATASYDAMGRMTSWSDAGLYGIAPASTVWEYDKAGNVRYVLSSYRGIDEQGNISGTVTTQDYWYLYDSMNRFVVTKGALEGTRGSGTIGIGSSGTQISYYADGSRRSALYGAYLLGSRWAYMSGGGPWGGPGFEIFPDGSGQDGTWTSVTFNFQGLRREDYYYTADGYLAFTGRAESWTDAGPQPGQYDQSAPEVIYNDPPATGGTLATMNLDAMGRTIYYKEYGGFDGSFERLNISYDNAGRELSEATVTLRRDTVGGQMQTYKTYITNSYVNGLVSSVFQDTYKNGDIGNSSADSAVEDSRQTYSYAWWDGALQSTIGNDKDNSGSIDWTTTFSYDGSGHVSFVNIADGRPRTVSLVTDQNGMIVDRDENDNQSGGDPRTLRYYFANIQMGMTSNNGTDNMAYAPAVKERLAPLSTSLQNGAFRAGSKAASPYADFEQSYDAINTANTGATGSSYTVNEGDTLQSIAQNVWGDSLLWYLLAQANGLSGSEPLAAGMLLTIPNKIRNSHNNETTWRVYNPNEALGDLSPTSIKPPKKVGACGIIARVIATVIAVVVSKLLPPIIGDVIGNIASQAFLIAVGQQNKINWKQVGIAAIAAVLTPPGTGNLIADIALNAAANIATQGVSIAVGLQKKFDWGGVAGAAVGSFVSGQLSRGLKIPALKPGNLSLGNLAANTGAALVGGVFNAATQTAFNGRSFGDNLLSVLPGAVGSTLGNFIGESLTRPPAYDGNGIVDRGEESDSYLDQQAAQARARKLAAAEEAESAPTSGAAAGPAGNDLMTNPYIQRAFDRAFPPIELPLLDLPELNDNGNPAVAALLREARRQAIAGAIADAALRQRLEAAGTADPSLAPQPSATPAAPAQVVTQAAGGVSGGPANNMDFLGWLKDNSGNDVPAFFRSNPQAYANDIAFHQAFARNVVNQAILNGRYFDVERVILPAAEAWGATDPGMAEQARIYREYVDQRTALANTATNQLVFAGVLAPMAIGAGGAAGVTLLAAEGMGLYSFTGSLITLDYAQSATAGLATGRFEFQPTVGGSSLSLLTNDTLGEGTYAILSLAHAFGPAAASRVRGPGAAAREAQAIEAAAAELNASEAARRAATTGEAGPATRAPAAEPEIDIVVTGTRPKRRYLSGAAQEEIQNIDRERVRRAAGPIPSRLADSRPHAHHIVEVNGRAGEYRGWVRESQDILRDYRIDPIYGPENLVQAPNRGHTMAEQRMITLELRAAQAAGAARTEIVEILQRFGRRATDR